MGDVDEDEQGEIFDEKKWGDEDKEKDEEEEQPPVSLNYFPMKYF